MSAYLCSWERPDNPTRGLSETAARAYWKDHEVEYDCVFALSAVREIDILAGWSALLERVRARGKHTPDDKRLVQALRQCWRAAKDGDRYAVPTIEPIVKARPAKVRALSHCPQCGCGLTAAA